MAELARPAEFGWPGGDLPGELDFAHRVDSPLAKAIERALAPHVGHFALEALTALTPPNGAFGRFALLLADRAYFLRVTEDWGHPALEQEITAWLRDHDVSVNHIEFSGVVFEFDGEEYRLDARALIRGRHFDESLEDLQELASVLGRCHAVLKQFPKADQVRAFSAERFDRLRVVRDRMRDALARRQWQFFASDDWAEGNVSWLEQLLAEFEPRFDLLPEAQCLHSQVHRANVIFVDDHHPILIDFEEAVHTFAPVSFDLAYFVQRFCLYDDPSNEVRSSRLETVRSAYGAPMIGVARMMQQTAWFSAVILVECHGRGVISPRSEYEKFVRLERQAADLAPILDRLA